MHTPDSIVARRGLAAAAGSILLIACCRPPAAGQMIVEREPLQALWERASPAPRALALAPDGAVVAVLLVRKPTPHPGRTLAPTVGGRVRRPNRDPLAVGGRSSNEKPRLDPASAAGDQKLRVYDRTGRLLWERWVDGCSRLVVGDGGRLVAAYAPHSALFRSLHLWDGTGRLQGAWTFTSPVESVVLSDDSRRVLVGTLAGEVNLFRRAGPGWERTNWRVDPPLRRLAFGPEQSVLVAGGAPPLLACLGSEGRTMWQAPLKIGTGARSFPGWSGPPWLRTRRALRAVDLATSANGRFIALAAETEEFGVSEAQLWSGRGRLLWRASLGGRAPCVRLSEDGDRIVVGYERYIPAGAGRTRVRRGSSRLHFERFLTCYNSSGAEQWSKGGAFFSPLLLALESRGGWVLSLGRLSKFWLLGRQGEPRWRSISPAPVQAAVGSRDGLSAAAYRTDGRLVYLAVSRPPG